MLLVATTALAATALGVAHHASDAEAAPATHLVTVESLDFTDDVNKTTNPAVTTIPIGDSVQWHWLTGTHTTTSRTGVGDSWNSGTHTAGDTFTHTFDVAGTFTYECLVHPGKMSGSVVVIDPNANPTATLTSTPTQTATPTTQSTATPPTTTTEVSASATPTTGAGTSTATSVVAALSSATTTGALATAPIPANSVLGTAATPRAGASALPSTGSSASTSGRTAFAELMLGFGGVLLVALAVARRSSRSDM